MELQNRVVAADEAAQAARIQDYLPTLRAKAEELEQELGELYALIADEEIALSELGEETTN